MMKNIAVIVYDLTIEYNITILQGISKFFKDKKDARLLIVPTYLKNAKETDYDYQYWTSLALMKSESIDAMIVVANSYCRFISNEEVSSFIKKTARCPVVSATIPLGLEKDYFISVDCTKSYEKVVEHLVKKHGRKKIAFFSASLTHSVESDERQNAYRKALLKAGIEYDENLVFPGDFTPTGACRYILKHFPRKEDLTFDAILCANDHMAAGCLWAFEELGVNIPEEMCVLGFDNTDISHSSEPTISTISQDVCNVGYSAGEMAYKLAFNEEITSHTIVEAFPVYRQSCGCMKSDMRTDFYINDEGVLKKSISLNSKTDIFILSVYNLTKIHQTLGMIDSYAPLETYFDSIVKHVKYAMLKSFAVCFYENPVIITDKDDFAVPKNASRLLLIDAEKNINENYYRKETIHFNPSENLFPDDFDSLEGGIYCLLPVFLREKNYGYMIAGVPDYNFTLYAIYLRIFTNIITQSYEISCTLNFTEKLTERNENLSLQSKTDELTGCFNRRGICEYGQKLIDLSVETGKTGCVFFCDLDGLKKINDTYGHRIGDIAIQTEVKVLKETFRDTDLIGRLSGDEFAVVAPGLSVDRIGEIREKLIENNERFSRKCNLPLTLSVSIGGSLFSKDKADLAFLISEADRELYKEKKIKHSNTAETL